MSRQLKQCLVLLASASSALAGNPPLHDTITLTTGANFHVTHSVNVASNTQTLVLTNSGANQTEVLENGFNNNVVAELSPSEYSLTLNLIPGAVPALDLAFERCAALASQLAALRTLDPNAKLTLQLVASPQATLWTATPAAMSLNLTKQNIATLECSL
jgi:hypothetical protein